MSKTILLLGGYGGTGERLVPLILKETDLLVRIAGRNLAKARQAAGHWNQVSGACRVEAFSADAANPESLAAACRGVDFVLVASCTAAFTANVAAAALDAGADYLDIMFPQGKLPVLRGLSERIVRDGRCFITEAGFHPGLAAVLVHYAFQRISCLKKAIVATVVRMKVEAAMPESIYELVEAFGDYSSRIFKNRQWQEVNLNLPGSYYIADFGARYGRQSCAPMFLEELLSLPELIPTLEETGFYAAGFNWFVDLIVFPIIMAALSVFGQRAVRPAARLMFWGIKQFSSPPYGASVRLDAAGQIGEKPAEMSVLLYHENEYVFTAVPVVACLLQYLDGSIKKPGLWLMGHLVDSERLLADMERMGIELQMVTETGCS
jgi:hypothetical protein